MMSSLILRITLGKNPYNLEKDVIVLGIYDPEIGNFIGDGPFIDIDKCYTMYVINTIEKFIKSKYVFKKFIIDEKVQEQLPELTKELKEIFYYLWQLDEFQDQI